MRRFFALIAFLLLSLSVHSKPVEIVLWHSMAGHLGEEVQRLIDGFNHSQEDYWIKPIYKGGYIESLTSFAAAFRAHQPPSMVQVFEVGSSTMLVPKGIIKPVDELMKEQKLSLPQDSFFPALRAYYSENGQLMAMPLNTSVPALFYNADLLAKAGYSKQSLPKTWDEFARLAAKLKKAGFKCVYTTAYPAWILIESFSAVHGLPLVDPSIEKAVYNNEPVIRHLNRLLSWQRLHYFEYGGRSDDATILFTSGRCPFMSQSSGGYNSIAELVPFSVGLTAIPLDEEASPQRFNNVTGGAALWVVSGQSETINKGIARFFVYMAEPKAQGLWHQNTGYLPLGMEGVYDSIVKESTHPSLRLAGQELMGHAEIGAVQRVSAQNQIRTINDEAIESIFAGIQSPKAAMDAAVDRANLVLRRFKQNTSDE